MSVDGSDGTLSSTAFLIPITTVCPADSDPTAPFPQVTLPTLTLSDVTASIVSATAILPDGSSTTFSSRQRRSDMTVANVMQAQATQLPDGTSAYPLGDASENEGKLVAGLDGCQTLYMPTSTVLCSTILTPAGLPPVTVSECDQLVTFSSQTFMTCYTDAASTPSATKSGSFTTRPFAQNDTYEDATTTYTPGATRAKRQILISDGKPMMTDLATVAPPPYMRADKRQILVSNGKPVLTALGTIAPTANIEERQVTAPATHEMRKYPHPHEHMKDRHRLVVSDLTGVLSANATMNGTLNATDIIASAAAPVTNLLPIPSALQAKYRRKDLVQGHHKRAEDALLEIRTSNLPTLMPNTTLNGTMSNNTLHASMQKLGSSIKIAEMQNAADFSPPQPTRYWAAPWQAVARGGVPDIVYDITCYGGMVPLGDCTVPDSDGDMEKCECSTITESWSVSTYTVTRYGTTEVSFDGPVAVTLADGRTTRTTLSFTDTFSTTATFQQEVVITSRLGEDTVTATLTSTPSATISLLDNSAQVTDVKANMAGAPQDAPSSIDDLPTTIYVTSTVATETVTVDPTTLPTGTSSVDGSSDVEADDAATTPPVKKNKRDSWPSDVWLAHMDDFQQDQDQSNEKRSMFEELVLSRLLTIGNPDACARAYMRSCMQKDLPQACSSIDDCPIDLLKSSLNSCESTIPEGCQPDHPVLVNRDVEEAASTDDSWPSDVWAARMAALDVPGLQTSSCAQTYLKSCLTSNVAFRCPAGLRTLATCPASVLSALTNSCTLTIPPICGLPSASVGVGAGAGATVNPLNILGGGGNTLTSRSAQDCERGSTSACMGMCQEAVCGMALRNSTDMATCVAKYGDDRMTMFATCYRACIEFGCGGTYPATRVINAMRAQKQAQTKLRLRDAEHMPDSDRSRGDLEHGIELGVDLSVGLQKRDSANWGPWQGSGGRGGRGGGWGSGGFGPGPQRPPGRTTSCSSSSSSTTTTTSSTTPTAAATTCPTSVFQTCLLSLGANVNADTLRTGLAACLVQSGAATQCASVIQQLLGTSTTSTSTSTSTSAASSSSTTTTSASSTTIAVQTCPTAVVQSCLVSLNGIVDATTLRTNLAACLVQNGAAAQCGSVIQQLLGTIDLKAKRDEMNRRPRPQTTTTSSAGTLPTGSGFSCPASIVTQCAAQLEGAISTAGLADLRANLAICLARQGGLQCQSLIHQLLGATTTKRDEANRRPKPHTTSSTSASPSPTNTLLSCPANVISSCAAQIQSSSSSDLTVLRANLAVCLAGQGGIQCQSLIQTLLGVNSGVTKRDAPALDLGITLGSETTSDECPASIIAECYASLQTMKFQDPQAMNSHLAVCLTKQAAGQCQSLIERLIDYSPSKRQLPSLGSLPGLPLLSGLGGSSSSGTGGSLLPGLGSSSSSSGSSGGLSSLPGLSLAGAGSGSSSDSSSSCSATNVQQALQNCSLSCAANICGKAVTSTDIRECLASTSNPTTAVSKFSSCVSSCRTSIDKACQVGT